MLSTALIVFREVLEAALILSIVLAATKGVLRRGWWVSGGLIGGIIGATVIAAFAGVISSWASGMGQEVFNASVMFVAVIMLGWHTIWMGRHSRELAQQMQAVGKAVAAGSRPLTGLAIVVGVAVLREGSEIVLFLYGIAVGGPGQAPQMFVGGVLGVLGGVGLGAGMYAGLLRIPLKRLFAVTNVMIILLAAGMASQGVGYLSMAGIVPFWGDSVWDTSWLLNESSIVGKMLHTLIGYTARPAGIQIAAYLTTIVVIVGLARMLGRSHAPAQGQPRQPA
jgi:high-affinity iron transporter